MRYRALVGARLAGGDGRVAEVLGEERTLIGGQRMKSSMTLRACTRRSL